MTDFVIKDSGRREQYTGGMVRDTQLGKTLYSLVFDGPMFKRWAAHLTKGAIKYAARNWMKAQGNEEADRFKESALRHFIDWFDGKEDEDHAAGVFFNVNGYEYVKLKMIEEIERENENAAREELEITPRLKHLHGGIPDSCIVPKGDHK